MTSTITTPAPIRSGKGFVFLANVAAVPVDERTADPEMDTGLEFDARLKEAPQFEQKVAPSGFWVPHFPQYIILTSKNIIFYDSK